MLDVKTTLFALLVLLLWPGESEQRLASSSACTAPLYSSPGFRSERQLFPAAALWDSVQKVSFQASDCSWRAAHFLDTRSEFVAVLFGGSTNTKVWDPLPQLADQLARHHGISSLTVDNAGRGESCGIEEGPGYSSRVCAHAPGRDSSAAFKDFGSVNLQVDDMFAAVRFVNSLPNRRAGALFGMKLLEIGCDQMWKLMHLHLFPAAPRQTMSALTTYFASLSDILSLLCNL